MAAEKTSTEKMRSVLLRTLDSNAFLSSDGNFSFASPIYSLLEISKLGRKEGPMRGTSFEATMVAVAAEIKAVQARYE